MIKEPFSSKKRKNKEVSLTTDFVVVGGGLAGVCAAITAARKGTKTILIQDRPVLGGNASSEVRLWALGATSHMGNNNRWSREGGVIDEIMVENVYRNQKGNPIIFDTILLEKVVTEKNITLLLNTAVSEVKKASDRMIKSVSAFNSQNSTSYTVSAPLFCDASGDGIVAYQAGASYRIGAEAKDMFGELMAPNKAYGHLLGHSMFFYSKPSPGPVKYVPPSYALKDISKIPRHKLIRKDHTGCNFWWFEYGGRRDTIHDTEEIKWELSKVIYGVWNYIKNSGEFEGVDHLDLEWVATVPGKRESRRFEGLYMLNQNDVIHQKAFDDAVAFGGWALDLHPADGVYSELPACTQWHSKGIYDIPYRCFVPKDIDNLFLAGRIISTSHVAFGSSRVMITCAFGAQAVGMAAALCNEKNINPPQVLEKNNIKALQNELNKTGQSVPNIPINPNENLINKSTVSASTSLQLAQIAPGLSWLPLSVSAAQLLPLKANQNYRFTIEVNATQHTTLMVQLRTAIKTTNYTPEVIIDQKKIELKKGIQYIDVSFDKTLNESAYGFIVFLANDCVSVKESDQRISGLVSVFNGVNEKVSNKGIQQPPDGIGVDTFEFWTPKRRPQGKNLALGIYPPIEAFATDNIGNGFVRPWKTANAWVASVNDEKPTIEVHWDNEIEIQKICLFFDTDYDHAMETVQFGHPEDIVPFCVQHYSITTIEGKHIKEKHGNYQTVNTHTFSEAVKTKGLLIEFERPSENVPAAIYEILIQ